jgi:hypothetical protein
VSKETKARSTQSPEEYGVSAETFIAFWEGSDNADEALEKIRAHGQGLGYPPMPKPIMIARAAKYRSKGVVLRRFKPTLPGPPELDVAGLNDIISKIKAGAPLPPAPQAAPRPARPARPADDSLMSDIEAVLARLKARHAAA